jgi:hypothetical protein
MSKQPMSEWDKMVGADLKQDLEDLANGKLKMISQEEAYRMMEVRLSELRQEEIKEQQQQYQSLNPFAYVNPAV